MGIYEDYLEQGIKERETGDLDKAIELLKEAVKSAEPGKQKACARNHLGLAYFHRGAYEIARVEWIAAHNISKVFDVPSEEAVSLRNLSRHQLYNNNGDLEGALECSLKALEMAKSQKRIDLIWFIHGIFSAKHALEIKKGQRKLVRQEARALIKVWRKVPKLERDIWASGLVMDIAIVTGKVSLFFLKIALNIVTKKGLERRKEQIEKLIDEIRRSKKSIN